MVTIYFIYFLGTNIERSHLSIFLAAASISHSVGPHGKILPLSPFSEIFSSIGALEMAMSVCLSVCLSVRVIQLFSSIQCMQRLFLDQSSLVQTSVDQYQSTLVKSSQILSNLVKSRKIFSRLFIEAYSACGGSLQSSLVQTRLVKTNLVYSSQSQSNLVKYI